MSPSTKMVPDQPFHLMEMQSQAKYGRSSQRAGQCESSIRSAGVIQFSGCCQHLKDIGDQWQAVMLILRLLDLKDLVHTMMTLKHL